jgi:hypothetical protein
LDGVLHFTRAESKNLVTQARKLCSFAKVYLLFDRNQYRIVFAYQAADASHPEGEELARRRAEKFAERSNLFQLQAAKAHNRKALPREGTSRTADIPVTAGDFFKV